MGDAGMKATLTIALSALVLSGCAPKTPILASMPRGDGNPSAISCYSGLDETSRIKHTQCKTNAEWARIRIDIDKSFPGI
jgi:hypothetical protein